MLLKIMLRGSLVKKGLGLVSLFYFIVACGLFPPPPHSPHAGAPTHPGSSGSPGSPTIPGQPSTPGTTAGVVKCTHQYPYAHFNQQIRGFLSAAGDTSNIGNVGCTKEQYQQSGSGIQVKGTVYFTGGKKLDLSNLSQTLEVNSASSKIKILIKPVNQRELAVDLKAAPIAGQVSGSIAVLSFEDEKGKVTLDGEFRSNDKGVIVFSAPFQYNNFVVFGRTDVTGHEGTIGQFEIPACGLFDCVR